MVGNLSEIQAAAGYHEFERLAAQNLHGRSLMIVNIRSKSICQFVDAVKNAEVMIADFDGTLIAGSQWSDARQMMNPEYLAEDRQLLEEWVSKPRTIATECAFIFSTVCRLIQSGINYSEFQKAAQAQSPRPGVIQLIRSFGQLADDSRPAVCIISFGMQDYIQAWAEYNEVKADIASLKLHWAEDKLIGYNPETVVVGCTKGRAARQFREKCSVNNEQILAIGDTIADIELFGPGSVNVLVVPQTETECALVKYRAAGLPKLWDTVNAVVVGDSLQMLADCR